MRTFFALVIASVGFGCAAPLKDWHRFETRHVILKTNAPPERGDALVRDLEKFRATIGALSGLDFSEDRSPKLRVYAFDSFREYRAISDLPGTGGVYQSMPDGAVSLIALVEAKQVYQLSGRDILLHEYTHHLFHQYSPLDYPRWYDEGFAEFVSTMEFEGPFATLGKPPVQRLIALREQGDWLRLEELLASKGRYLSERNNPTGLTRPSRKFSKLSYQYAQGWLTVHFLHNDSRFTDGLRPYLSAVSQGVEESEAFKAAFGVSHREMDRALHDYWSARTLPWQRVDMSNVLGPIEVAQTKLTPEVAATVPFEARLQFGRVVNFEEADAAFSRAAAQLPERMAEFRAAAAIQVGRYADADARIAELDPSSSTTAVLRARLIFAKIHDSKSKSADEIVRPTQQQIAEIRQLAQHALDADPYNVPARLLAVRASLSRENFASEDDLQLLEDVRVLAPDLHHAKRLQVELLSRLERYDEALEILDKMIFWAHSGGAEGNLVGLRKSIVQMREKQRGDPEAQPET